VRWPNGRREGGRSGAVIGERGLLAARGVEQLGQRRRDVVAENLAPRHGERLRARARLTRSAASSIGAISAAWAVAAGVAAPMRAIACDGRAAFAAAASIAAGPAVAAPAARSARVHESGEERLFARRDDGEVPAAAAGSAHPARAPVAPGPPSEHGVPAAPASPRRPASPRYPSPPRVSMTSQSRGGIALTSATV